MAQVYNAARNERRKMMLQAALNARRNSLMNLITPDVYAEEGPGVTLPAPPRPTVSSNVVELPAPLPGRDIVDANNAEALAFANQHPGQNLTDVFNRQAALRTGNDLANMRSAEVEREARAAVVQNQFMNNALEQHPNSPPPGYQDQAAPPQVAAPMATDYGPGLTPAAAEELYGPGGMYGTQPLAGGLYDQMGISPAGMGISPTGMGSTISSPVPTKTASQHLADEINTIKRKAGIIRGTAALFGGNPKAADRYEAKALANLSDYAGQYALSQLTDADFQNKARFIQAATKNLMPTKLMTDLLPYIGLDSKGKPKAQEKQIFVDPQGKEHRGVIRWDTQGNLYYEKEDGTPAPSEWMPRAARGSSDKKATSAFANSDLYTKDSRRTYLVSGNPSDLVFSDQAVSQDIALKDIPPDLRDTAYINLLEKQLSDLDPNSEEYREKSESLERLKADYNNNKWANAQCMRKQWVAATSAYDNVVNLSDRIMEQLAKVDVTTGVVAGTVGVFEGVADQIGQASGLLGGTAVDKNGNPINETDLRDESVYRDALETAGVSAQLRGNIIELAYAIARLREPGGRLSTADVENAIKTIAPDGQLSKSVIAANIMEIDNKTYLKMSDTHRRFVENHLPVEAFRYKRGPIIKRELGDGVVWYGYNTLEKRKNNKTGKMEDWHETLWQGAN